MTAPKKARRCGLSQGPNVSKKVDDKRGEGVIGWVLYEKVNAKTKENIMTDVESTLPASVVSVSNAAQLALAFDIRREVFIEEQGVSEAEEIDGLDAVCDHVLYMAQGQAVATGRLRVVEESGVKWGKIERIAVRKTWRGQGLGKAIVEGLVALGQHPHQLRHFKLGSQCDAIPFYEKLGFEAYGDIFLDARIPHRMMKKVLP